MKKKPKSQNPDRDHPFIELTEGAMSFFRKYYAPILNSECSQAASVFDVLVTFVNRENGPDNGLAFPSRKGIQAQLGGEGRISELQITRCTKCLESHSFLLERRKGAPGKSMRYRGQIPSREKFLSTYGFLACLAAGWRTMRLKFPEMKWCNSLPENSSKQLLPTAKSFRTRDLLTKVTLPIIRVGGKTTGLRSMSV